MAVAVPVMVFEVALSLLVLLPVLLVLLPVRVHDLTVALEVQERVSGLRMHE